MPPKKKSLDSRGYYRLLKVSSEADVDEIRLAVAMARQNASGSQLRKIDEAWETLSNAGKRKAYDGLGLERVDWLKSPLTLAACAVLLLAAFMLLWLPDISLRRKAFSTGQTLVETRTGREFGMVVRVESSHRFPDGQSSTAYLVRPSEGGPDRWYPAIDLQVNCSAR